MPRRLGDVVSRRSYFGVAVGITMNSDIEVTLYEEIVDSLDILVLACVGRANDGANTNGVLVNQIDTFFGINNPSFLGAIDVLRLVSH